MAQLGEIEGLERLRFTTSHPRDMDAALIAAHGDNEKLMPYLHLPVQSGSDAILKAMNRKHTAADYLALVKNSRRASRFGAVVGFYCRLSRRDGRRFCRHNGVGRRSALCASLFVQI